MSFRISVLDESGLSGFVFFIGEGSFFCISVFSKSLSTLQIEVGFPLSLYSLNTVIVIVGPHSGFELCMVWVLACDLCFLCLKS